MFIDDDGLLCNLEIAWKLESKYASLPMKNPFTMQVIHLEIAWKLESKYASLPMKNPFTVQVIQRKAHLHNVQGNLLFGEEMPLIEVVSQISAQHQIQHHEHIFVILKGVAHVH